MFHTSYIKGLQLACELHEKYREQINVNIKDRRLAVYYLQGGSLTHAYLSVKNWEYGDLNGVHRVQRFIAEVNELLFFFTTEEKVDRHLNNFFKGRMLDIRSFNKDDEFVEKMDKIMLKKTGLTVKQNHRLLKEAFSTGMHPTLYSSAYNSDKKTGEFDYKLEGEEFCCYPIKNFDFGNFIIIPAMQSVYLYNQAFQNNSGLIKKVEDYSNYIQELSIQ